MTHESFEHLNRDGLRQSWAHWLATAYNLSPALHRKMQFSVRLVFVLLSLLGAVAGLSAMSGMMAMGASAPVNVLLIVAVFVVLPSVFSLLSLVGLGRAAGGVFGWFLGPWLEHRYGQTAQLSLETQDHELLMRWLSWQSHWFSIGFLVCALLSFFAFVTLQDYQFAWSTTVQGAEPVIENILYGMIFFVESFSDLDTRLLIKNSRATQGELFSSSGTGGWWFVIAAMILLYGLGLRMLALYIARRRYQRLLLNVVRRTASKTSTEPYSFVKAQYDQPNQNADEYPILELDTKTLKTCYCIAWQQECSNVATLTLGVDRWQDDLDAIETLKVDKQLSTVCVLAAASSVPTAELTDILKRLSSRFSPLTVRLVITANDIALLQRSKLSWQAYAQRHQLSLGHWLEGKS